ncbi:hypothetical protein Acy02nite_32900 [Actinoplanes cyaneus]|uniref:Uncharacterized protein n=1 Tax=Actinoplanes cyaneus TaxID=52696 RepID=A0A919IGH3_9ACTN|nr:hypothetical protein [Actinoplanes cyaneus]MCW2140095.1 hypothetical protein [Actinoplanes cyaneus]GID65409.1 hypothetical protein Acy02nite_32900 [Actinoplanes cyaneus]
MMISLAAAVYGEPGSHPGELLAAEVTEARHTVEDHLLDHAVIVRFGGDGRAAARLTFLATYLHQHRERDLAWWRMSERLLPRLAVPAFALLLGLVMMVLGALLTPPVAALLGETDGGTDESLAAGGVAGGAFAVLFVLTWYAVPTRLPG